MRLPEHAQGVAVVVGVFDTLATVLNGNHGLAHVCKFVGDDKTGALGGAGVHPHGTNHSVGRSTVGIPARVGGGPGVGDDDGELVGSHVARVFVGDEAERIHVQTQVVLQFVEHVNRIEGQILVAVGGIQGGGAYFGAPENDEVVRLD